MFLTFLELFSRSRYPEPLEPRAGMVRKRHRRPSSGSDLAAVAIEQTEQQQTSNEAPDVCDPGNRLPVAAHPHCASDDIHDDPKRDQRPQTTPRPAVDVEAKDAAKQTADRPGCTNDGYDRRRVDRKMGECGHHIAEQR